MGSSTGDLLVEDDESLKKFLIVLTEGLQYTVRMSIGLEKEKKY